MRKSWWIGQGQRFYLEDEPFNLAEVNSSKGGEVPPTSPVGQDPTELGEAEIIFVTTPCWLNRGGWLARVGVVAV